MRTQTVDLNLIPGSVSPTIHLTQYDKDDNSLVFNVYGEPGFYIPVNSTAVITGTKPDGYGFSYSASINGNVVTANVTQQMTAVAGIVKCELRITKNNNNVGSQTFYLDVKAAALDENTVISDSDLAAIAMAEQYASSAAQSAGEAETLVSQINGLGRGEPTRVTSGSINAIVNPGYYYCVLDSVTDLPEGINGDLWVFSTGIADGTVVQIFRRVGTVGTNDNNIYIRRINNTGTDTTSWWKYIDSETIINNYVRRSGGDDSSMNGHLVIDNNKNAIIHSIVPVDSNPSSNTYGAGFYIQGHADYDDAYHNIAWYRGVKYSNGRQGLQLQAVRTVNGASVYNGFIITIDGEGNGYYTVSNVPAFRSAIDASGDHMSLSPTCIGYLTSTSSRLVFDVPYNIRNGMTTFTATRLNVIVRHALGGYLSARSGSDGSTITQLGSSWVSLINSDGTYVRDNEISSITYGVIPGHGLTVTVNFVYALLKSNNTTDTAVNNTPISIAVSIIGDLT